MNTASTQTTALPAPADVATELLLVVENGTRMLRAIEASASLLRPANKWSARQVVGHLVDSAANNHARFVRGQIEEDLVFAGYLQDEWVELQAYDDEPWDQLVDLWNSYNRHIAHIIARVDSLEWSRPRARHNFDHIGFATIEASRLGTLGWLVVDYVTHLRHHLDEIERFHAGRA